MIVAERDRLAAPRRPLKPLICGLALCAALSISALSSCTPPSEAPKTPGAIVLLTIDTLRVDHTGAGGYALPTTPFLDSLAKEGVWFSQAYATSSATPLSMASIFTGLMPTSHGFNYASVDPRSGEILQPVLAPEHHTLTEHLDAAGYTTVGVASNINLSSARGFDQGFDAFFKSAAFLSGRQLNTLVPQILEEVIPPPLNGAWRGRSLFFWLHYFDPHDPYFAYPIWLEQNASRLDPSDIERYSGLTMSELRRHSPSGTGALSEVLIPLYDGEIRQTDVRFRDIWTRMGFDDNTLLIVTADHGEEFGDHGGLGHSSNLYQEVTRVPLILRWPKGLPQGRVIDTPVSILDIYPTLMALANVPIPEGLHGQNLLPVLQAAGEGQDRVITMELESSGLSRHAQIVQGQKVIWSQKPEERVEFYDLRRDPREERDLSETQPEAAQRALSALKRTLADLPPPPGQPAATGDQYSKEELDALRSMGYLE